MNPLDDADPAPLRATQFTTTQWSLVLAAGRRDSDGSIRALNQLCHAYWAPLYAYARRHVADYHQAQDLTQAFFERLLEKEYLADADPERGRFRSFLITAFKRFLSKERDKTAARKRGGGKVIFSVDFASHDRTWDTGQDTLTAERIYERQWAVTLLNRVMDRLQREMERNGRAQHFQVLKAFLAGTQQVSYAEIAPVLGLSESAARMAASRLRSRYRELLREEISQTVAHAEDTEDEIRQLFTALAD